VLGSLILFCAGSSAYQCEKLFVFFSVFKGKAVQSNPSTVGQERLWTESHIHLYVFAF